MRFTAALLATVLMATSTLAEITIPEGYWLKKVTPVLHPPKVAWFLPGPLLNATLDCKKRYLPADIWYDIRGTHWDGVTEKQIKAACNAGNALMTDWVFESREVQHCTLDMKAQRHCTDEWHTEWYATFAMTMVYGHEFAMTDAFDRLSGAYGDVNHLWERASWEMTNGTHDLNSDMNKEFPPAGWQFRCFSDDDI